MKIKKKKSTFYEWQLERNYIMTEQIIVIYFLVGSFIILFYTFF